MRRPNQPPEEESGQDAPEDGSPSFEDLMLMVFSGPMCFECLEEGEAEEGEVEEGEVEEGEADGEEHTGEKSN